MAEVLIQNLRDPDQIAVIMVTLRRMVIPEEGSGKPLWILEASTSEMDVNGDDIPPARKWLSDRSSFTEDVNDLLNELAAKINWTYYPDTTPPAVVGVWPLDGAQSVSVNTDIYISLSEEVPSSGIDLDSIQVKVKGFDLTDQVTIKGNMSSCSVLVTPGTKFQSAINEDFHNGSEYTPD
jgi:hypothetical protein